MRTIWDLYGKKIIERGGNRRTRKIASTFSRVGPPTRAEPPGCVRDTHRAVGSDRGAAFAVSASRGIDMACGLSGAELPPGKWQRRLGRPFSGGRGAAGASDLGAAHASTGGKYPATLHGAEARVAAGAGGRCRAAPNKNRCEAGGGARRPSLVGSNLTYSYNAKTISIHFDIKRRLGCSQIPARFPKGAESSRTGSSATR